MGSQLRDHLHLVQNPFTELVRLLVLIALTVVAAVFGSFWVWGLLGAVSWNLFAAVRSTLRPV
jgi:hypothetical protein